jgi:hypothetical protein
MKAEPGLVLPIVDIAAHIFGDMTYETHQNVVVPNNGLC